MLFVVLLLYQFIFCRTFPGRGHGLDGADDRRQELVLCQSPEHMRKIPKRERRFVAEACVARIVVRTMYTEAVPVVGTYTYICMSALVSAEGTGGGNVMAMLSV
jgi:hypothetical protein